MKTFDTKKQAIKAANELRANGHTVKVFCRSGTYTQPFKGIVAYVEYFLEVK